MVDKALYIILSIFDAAAMIILMFKLYRLPIMMYAKRISVLALIITLSSYFFRVEISIAYLDLPIQYLIFVLFLRYVIRMKFHYSAFVAAAGMLGFFNIQLLIYYFFDASGALDSSIVKEISGMAVYAVQVSTEVAIFLLSFILWKFNLGFSFIIIPPHDFSDKEDFTSRQNIEMISSTLISVITIFAAIIFLNYGYMFPLILLAIISFGLSYYFSRKGDMQW
ncbi:hypothetical protein [Paenibacillus shenyangensis]|uniref:hypothetical protein n=1 Tax=Paenibacillus sp. A9 TaxID=1284352 RepID=UPI00037C1630|nr:hypothetical protein [Paenibacillus sp. A9]